MNEMEWIEIDNLIKRKGGEEKSEAESFEPSKRGHLETRRKENEESLDREEHEECFL